ncbi:hypothetical protein [Mucilaginibacter arboris]|uniref:hypothetical protein n=1 Tax=Mucilaginibacter arboris TaxID=2682090 RepID=UPI0018DCB7B1|nr:hypothetical protein [Mucilaginibacter arboris]
MEKDSLYERDKLIYDYIGVNLYGILGVIEEIIPKFHNEIIKIIKTEKDKGL